VGVGSDFEDVHFGLIKSVLLARGVNAIAQTQDSGQERVGGQWVLPVGSAMWHVEPCRSWRLGGRQDESLALAR